MKKETVKEEKYVEGCPVALGTPEPPGPEPTPERTIYNVETRKLYRIPATIGTFIFPEVPETAYMYPTIPLYNSEEPTAQVNPNSEWGTNEFENS